MIRICISLKKTLFLFVAAHIFKGDTKTVVGVRKKGWGTCPFNLFQIRRLRTVLFFVRATQRHAGRQIRN
ncbi:unnamed protein product [Larinioides sclopetarius]|uniref:Secreted protein n=1 Tax=Larinioides sclopetarius TaxID=280406 RepID=A0AAV2A2Z3_9ARAC